MVEFLPPAGIFRLEQPGALTVAGISGGLILRGNGARLQFERGDAAFINIHNCSGAGMISPLEYSFLTIPSRLPAAQRTPFDVFVFCLVPDRQCLSVPNWRLQSGDAIPDSRLLTWA